jgi:hypothetical protein
MTAWQLNLQRLSYFPWHVFHKNSDVQEAVSGTQLFWLTSNIVANTLTSVQKLGYASSCHSLDVPHRFCLHHEMPNAPTIFMV